MVGRLFHSLAVSFVVILAAPAAAAPLHDAARVGDEAAVEQLIEDGAELEAFDKDGETPLTSSALAGRQEILELLIDRGAKINGRNEGGFTALHAAAYVGNKTIVEFLLDRGADIDDQNNKSGLTALHAAAETDHGNVVQLLLARGARTDLKEFNGWTPVARATFKRFPDVVTILRDHGARCPPPTAVGLENFNYCQNPGG